MALKSQKKVNPIPQVDILGVKVDDITFNEAVERIVNLSRDKKDGHYVVTVNSEFVMLAKKNHKFGQILSKADLALADGAGVVFAKLILGGNVQGRIAGVDLVEKLCQVASKNAIRVGFLGGFDDVANVVAKRQELAYPGLKVVISVSGEPTIGYDSKLKRDLDALGRVDILFVAYGMGQQEFWIQRNLENRLNVGVFIGVGGAFDYLASVKRRAPRFFQNIGLEWFWRLLLEPKRFWRMRVLPIFLFLVFGQWLAKNRLITLKY